MKDQYKNSAPKITVASAPDKEDKNTSKRIRDLSATVEQQQEQINRMHRDIVRLRVTINELANRIK